MPRKPILGEPLDRRLTISLLPKQRARLDRVASKNQMSAAALVRLAIDWFIGEASRDPDAMQLRQKSRKRRSRKA